MPDKAEYVDPDGSRENITTSQLNKSHLVLVRPGASVPADGVVVEGESSVDEAIITGESKPVNKVQGSHVVGGSINGDGGLRVRVTATGERIALAVIMRW